LVTRSNRISGTAAGSFQGANERRMAPMEARAERVTMAGGVQLWAGGQ
jgi:hypothetical protein